MSFLSFLKAIGHDLKKGLDFLLTNSWVQAGEAIAINTFAPGLGPLFNATKQAVMLAELKATALGHQDGSGPQKLADVASTPNSHAPFSANSPTLSGKGEPDTGVRVPLTLAAYAFT
jgi:hypothetical protein